MSVYVKQISELPIAEEVNGSEKIIINDNGETKQLPVNKVTPQNIKKEQLSEELLNYLATKEDAWPSDLPMPSDGGFGWTVSSAGTLFTDLQGVVVDTSDEYYAELSIDIDIDFSEIEQKYEDGAKLFVTVNGVTYSDVELYADERYNEIRFGFAHGEYNGNIYQYKVTGKWFYSSSSTVVVPVGNATFSMRWENDEVHKIDGKYFPEGGVGYTSFDKPFYSETVTPFTPDDFPFEASIVDLNNIEWPEELFSVCKISIDGTEYIVPATNDGLDFYYFGELDKETGFPKFDKYPFFIVAGDAIYTKSNSEYNLQLYAGTIHKIDPKYYDAGGVKQINEDWSMTDDDLAHLETGVYQLMGDVEINVFMNGESFGYTLYEGMVINVYNKLEDGWGAVEVLGTEPAYLGWSDDGAGNYVWDHVYIEHEDLLRAAYESYASDGFGWTDYGAKGELIVSGTREKRSTEFGFTQRPGWIPTIDDVGAKFIVTVDGVNHIGEAVLNYTQYYADIRVDEPNFSVSVTTGRIIQERQYWDIIGASISMYESHYVELYRMEDVVHKIDEKYLPLEELWQSMTAYENAKATGGIGWTDEDDTVHTIDPKYISGGSTKDDIYFVLDFEEGIYQLSLDTTTEATANKFIATCKYNLSEGMGWSSYKEFAEQYNVYAIVINSNSQACHALVPLSCNFNGANGNTYVTFTGNVAYYNGSITGIANVAFSYNPDSGSYGRVTGENFNTTFN